MIALEIGGHGLASWVQPSTYDEAVRAQFGAMPGCRWNHSAGRYEGPQEALSIVAATLASAGVAVLRGGWDLGAESESALAELSWSWPSAMRDYQRDGASWIASELARTGGALLADEMGIGKTLQAIVALQHSARTLVLAPAIAVPNWRRQLRLWGARGEWLVMSPEKFQRAAAKRDPVLDGDWSAVVLDELQYYANPKSKRSAAVRDFLAARPTVRRLGLTGTPIQTRVRDIWQPLDLLWPGRFGDFWRFQKRYCNGHYEEIPQIAKPVWVADGQSHLAELQSRLAVCMLRRTKADVALELPSLTRVVREIDLPAKVANGAKRMAKSAVEHSLIGHDFQGSIGALLDGVESYKVEAAAELAREISDSGGRPLLLCRTRAAAESLGLALACPVATGDVPADRRRDVLLAGGGPAVSTIFAVTTGIDLIEFDSVIFVSPDWVPATLLQAEARAHRLGSLRPVTAYYLVGLGTVDETIRERVIDRLETIATLLGSGDESAMAQSLGGSEDEIIAALAAQLTKAKTK